MSCNTGNGFAKKMSLAFKSSSFTAPNNYYIAARNGSWSGVAGQKNLNNPGRWLTFVNGVNINYFLLY